jgi:hypothetical protein
MLTRSKAERLGQIGKGEPKHSSYNERDRNWPGESKYLCYPEGGYDRKQSQENSNRCEQFLKTVIHFKHCGLIGVGCPGDKKDSGKLPATELSAF